MEDAEVVPTSRLIDDDQAPLDTPGTEGRGSRDGETDPPARLSPRETEWDRPRLGPPCREIQAHLTTGRRHSEMLELRLHGGGAVAVLATDDDDRTEGLHPDPRDQGDRPTDFAERLVADPFRCLQNEHHARPARIGIS